jgi:hypothetical protein
MGFSPRDRARAWIGFHNVVGNASRSRVSAELG